jgi:hypothetical protein
MESGESGDLRKNRGQRIKEKNGCFERERESVKVVEPVTGT